MNQLCLAPNIKDIPETTAPLAVLGASLMYVPRMPHSPGWPSRIPWNRPWVRRAALTAQQDGNEVPSWVLPTYVFPSAPSL